MKQWAKIDCFTLCIKPPTMILLILITYHSHCTWSCHICTFSFAHCNTSLLDRLCILLSFICQCSSKHRCSIYNASVIRCSTWCRVLFGIHCQEYDDYCLSLAWSLHMSTGDLECCQHSIQTGEPHWTWTYQGTAIMFKFVEYCIKWRVVVKLTNKCWNSAVFGLQTNIFLLFFMFVYNYESWFAVLSTFVIKTFNYIFSEC